MHKGDLREREGAGSGSNLPAALKCLGKIAEGVLLLFLIFLGIFRGYTGQWPTPLLVWREARFAYAVHSNAQVTPNFIVDVSGGGHFRNIQKALSAVQFDGAIIAVLPGVYKSGKDRNLQVKHRVLIYSTGGADVTILDPDRASSIFYSVTAPCVIRGLTLMNAYAKYGAIVDVKKDFILQNCVIRDNATCNGNFFRLLGGHLSLIHCTLSRNEGKCLIDGVGSVSIRKSILWNEVEREVSPANFDIRHSIVRGGAPGQGNLDIDPQLTRDGHLMPSSPARGATWTFWMTDRDGEYHLFNRDLGADQFVDSNQNGLPDAWKKRWFSSLSPRPRDDPDHDEADNLMEYKLGTNPNDADTDNDGLMDGEEVTAKTDPLREDSDQDDLTDGEEVKIYQTDPLNKDTDGDGYNDGLEVHCGSFSLLSESPTAKSNAVKLIRAWEVVRRRAERLCRELGLQPRSEG